MLRLTALLALLLLAGCASPSAPVDGAVAGPAPDEETAAGASPSGGWVVTATRVEPRAHSVEWTGSIGARPCATDGSEACRGPALMQQSAAAGITWDEPTLRFEDPQGLFWRLAVALDWRTQNPFIPGLELDVYTVMDCTGCEPRLVQTFTGAAPLMVDNLDVFLQPHEVGLGFVVRASQEAIMESAWGAAAVEFEMSGAVAAFVAAAPPVVIS